MHITCTCTCACTFYLLPAFACPRVHMLQSAWSLYVFAQSISLLSTFHLTLFFSLPVPLSPHAHGSRRQVLCMAYMFIAPTLTLTLLALPTPTQVLCMAYMFIALAIVCDEYFVRYLVITPSSSYHP